jgi:hypothetical protein
MDIKKMLEGLKTSLEKVDTVEKSFPMKPEWVKASKELDVLSAQMDAIRAEAESKKKLLWGTIERDLKIYDKSMRLNDVKKLIEVIKD